MSEEEKDSLPSEFRTGWVRRDDHDPRHLHQYTSLIPRWDFDVQRHTDERVSENTDSVVEDPDERRAREVPFFLAFGKSNSEQRKIGRLFTFLLRHSSTVIVALGLLVIVYSFYPSTPLEPVTELPIFENHVGSISYELQLLSILLVTTWGVILIVFSHLLTTGDEERGDSDDPHHIKRNRFFRLTSFYFPLTALVIGTVYSIHLVTFYPAFAEQSQNVVFMSGYLLLLYIAGPLIYDGMLRTDNLFTTLRDQNHLFNGDESRKEVYRKFFLKPLIKTLQRSSVIPPSLFISILFVSQFGLIWYLTQGPFNTGSWLPLGIALFINVILVVITVQFIILILYLYPLFQGSEHENRSRDPTSIQDVHLHYRPGNPDESGGFSDFGKLATRVNVLLVLAGLYLVYRLYVQGFRSPLDAGSVIWHLDYSVPVIVYILVIILWVYLSFWTLHTKMRMERKWYLYKETRGSGGSQIEDVEKLRAFADAPEWPLDNQVLFTVFTLDVLSIFLALVSLFG